MSGRLAIVTASTNLDQARPCLESWIRFADESPVMLVVINGTTERPDLPLGIGSRIAWIQSGEYLGSVSAFRQGVDHVLTYQEPAEIIACLHDDFEIREQGWDTKVLRYFDQHPAIGLAGFGGAVGLGALDMYKRPYDPMSLARVGFRSDLEDAEAHGIRSVLAERVACLDGFSQIGRRNFWEGHSYHTTLGPDARYPLLPDLAAEGIVRWPWQVLEELGIVHHGYDGMLGCLAARYGWETWYLPLRSKHWGGRTAVGDPGYQAWAASQAAGGDHGFWQAAHKTWYEQFRDVLPLRL